MKKRGKRGISLAALAAVLAALGDGLHQAASVMHRLRGRAPAPMPTVAPRGMPWFNSRPKRGWRKEQSRARHRDRMRRQRRNG